MEGYSEVKCFGSYLSKLTRLDYVLGMVDCMILQNSREGRGVFPQRLLLSHSCFRHAQRIILAAQISYHHCKLLPAATEHNSLGVIPRSTQIHRKERIH
jgi:hypothetical protein